MAVASFVFLENVLNTRVWVMKLYISCDLLPVGELKSNYHELSWSLSTAVGGLTL